MSEKNRSASESPACGPPYPDCNAQLLSFENRLQGLTPGTRNKIDKIIDEANRGVTFRDIRKLEESLSTAKKAVQDQHRVLETIQEKIASLDNLDKTVTRLEKESKLNLEEKLKWVDSRLELLESRTNHGTKRARPHRAAGRYFDSSCSSLSPQECPCNPNYPCLECKTGKRRRA